MIRCSILKKLADKTHKCGDFMNINIEAIYNASLNLKEIISATPKNAKTKNINHYIAVQLIKDNLSQASVLFNLAGVINLAEACESLLKEVEKVSNIKKDHGLDYKRIRHYSNLILNSLTQKKKELYH